MKTTLLDSTTRIWWLSGLTGMVLMAGVFLEEGQARTFFPSPVNSSIQTSRLNPQAQSSEPTKTLQPEPSHTYLKQKGSSPAIQKEGTNKNPAKKRMGLAILFLGILAEED